MMKFFTALLGLTVLAACSTKQAEEHADENIENASTYFKARLPFEALLLYLLKRF